MIAEGRVLLSCCTTTSLEYHRSLALDKFTSDDLKQVDALELYRSAPVVEVTVPVTIEYYLQGDNANYAITTNVTVRVKSEYRANKILEDTGTSAPDPQD
jgi:hypothetical protein